MTERPILFSAPMVRALLDGRKTQTRRIVKPQPPAHAGDIEESEGYPGEWFYWLAPDERSTSFFCPYGVAGDRLWVREAWQSYPMAGNDGASAVIYRADRAHAHLNGWKPSMFMPRAGSRITLEVVEVRVERVEDISEADAHAEGATFDGFRDEAEWQRFGVSNPLDARFRCAYLRLFYEINKRTPPGSNPWVWVVEFRRVP